MLFEIAILLLFLVLGYAWIGYPLVLALLVRPRPERAQARTEVGRVDVLVAAHDEATCIAARIENLVEAADELRTSTPPQSGATVRIWIGVDGSVDATGRIARERAEKHLEVRVREFEDRRGKVAVLKDLVAESGVGCDVRQSTDAGEGLSHESLLVFTDANTMFRPGAIEKLLRHFADSKTGGVCGRLELTCARNPSPGSEPGSEPTSPGGRGREKSSLSISGSKSLLRSIARVGSGWKNSLSLRERAGVRGRDWPARGNPEGVYWRWENWLKEKESDLDSCLGANGAIYAIRRALFPVDLPDNTIVDDFVIGMKVREQGLRMVYDPDAVAEEAVPDRSDEWRRRVRIGAGDYQALWLCRRCLGVRYGKTAWMFWSHKVLRWFTPQMMLVLFVLSWMLAWKGGTMLIPGVPRGAPLVILSAALGCGFIGAATAGLRGAALKPFALCSHFLTMQAALLVGFVRFCRGGLKGAWPRTPRGMGEG